MGWVRRTIAPDGARGDCSVAPPARPPPVSAPGNVTSRLVTPMSTLARHAVRTLLLASPLLAAPATAQSNAERMANDRYTRSHDYDLVHQRIELRDFDWDSTSFTGRVTTTLVALRPAMDSVILDAGPLLRVARARDARGATLRTAARGDTLVVHLARPVAFHDTVRFTLDYQARVNSGRGLTFIQADGRPHRPRQIWSQGEAMDNHYWFPTYDFPNDKMTWDMVVTVPAGYTAISNGRLVSDRRGKHGTRTLHWAQERPASTYLVSLIVGRYAKIHDRWRGIPVDYYVYPEDTAKARRLFRLTPDVMEVYSRLTGVDYPWAKYAQTTVADFFGGMENVSATTLIDWLPDERAYRDRPWYQYILIPHELAHQWFGDYTTTENWANTWLNEGFAEFMPGAYWAAKLGRHAADDYFVDEYRQYLAIDQRRRMPLASLGANAIYPKGALVLRMLQRYLGEERFWASVHEYLTRHAYGSATTDDLRQAVLAATGENLDWFWDQWIYQAGYPAFSVTASYDSTAQRLALTVKQTQTDTSTADSTGLRYSTPAVFRMPVTIRVGTARGDVVRTEQLTAREQTITIDGLPGPPTMVVFDDGNAIVKSLDFEQPTTWLATQLERDPDLWNRSWVTAQLRERTADTVAARALAMAATGADYYLTRAEAAAALANFPAAVALPALEVAMGDSSSQVRRSALFALGRLGGDRALALVRSAFAHDSSYAVRAAAVTVLAQLDSAGRREVLTTALGIPSYQDVIQSAALDAIARAADTSFVPQLEQLLGAQPRVALALATLASRGSAHALDVLSAHLNDARPYVRSSVVLAFTRRMDPAVAVPRLQAVMASLEYEDTRTQVGEMIASVVAGK